MLLVFAHELHHAYNTFFVFLNHLTLKNIIISCLFTESVDDLVAQTHELGCSAVVVYIPTPRQIIQRSPIIWHAFSLLPRIKEKAMENFLVAFWMVHKNGYRLTQLLAAQHQHLMPLLRYLTKLWLLSNH